MFVSVPVCAPVCVPIHVWSCTCMYMQIPVHVPEHVPVLECTDLAGEEGAVLELAEVESDEIRSRHEQ